MNAQTAIYFSLLCLILAITPGPDMVLVLNFAVRRRYQGILAALGSSTGSLIWAVLVAIGVATYFDEHPSAAALLHFAGGLYLTYLGINEIWHYKKAGLDLPPASRPRTANAYLAGVTSCMLNVKVGLFFLVVAPQFAPDLEFDSVLLMGLIDGVVAFWCLSAIALIAHTITQSPKALGRTRMVTLVGGIAMVCFGFATLVSAIF
ncbi:LysE family translocator [Rhodococcus cerastii]|nr:LysE family translocator [Rhodococcus cerastii]